MIWNKIFRFLNSFAIHSTDHAALTSLPSQTIPIALMSVKHLTIELRTVKVLTSKCDQCHKASQSHRRASPLTADWINTQLHHSGSQPALKSRNLPQSMIDKGFDFLLEQFFGITAIPSFLCWLSKDKPNDNFQYSLAKPIVLIKIRLHDTYVRHSCNLVNNFLKSKKPIKKTHPSSFWVKPSSCLPPFRFKPQA